MTSGGARARSGPVADLNSYRQRRNADGWITLPERVDRRRTPNWPLNPAPTDRERDLWKKFWRMGQSIMWEAEHQELALALYVRLLAVVETDLDAQPASKITQARIMAEDLGVSLAGMHRHKWRFRSHEDLQEAAKAAPVAEIRRRPSTAEQLANLFGADPDDGE